MLAKRYLPSLSALQCFEAVARHLSFTRAAGELSLTQSAVSKQVAQLEEQLQHALLHRARRGLRLTAAGELYLDETRKILAQVEASAHYLRSYGGETEVLRIASPATFAACWLIPRTKGWRLQYPQVHLDVRSAIATDPLGQGGCDLAVHYGRGSYPGASCVHLLDERLIPVCAPSLLSSARPAAAEDLAELVLLQHSDRPHAWHDWFASLALDTAPCYHGPRFDTFQMCIQAARAGCGVTLVPDFLVAEELAEGKLVQAWPHDLHSPDAYYLAYPEHQAQLPKVRAFVEWIGQHR